MEYAMIEPLDPIIWTESFAKLRESLDMEDGNISAKVRKAYHLLVLAPGPLKIWFAPMVSEGMFERALEESEELGALCLLSCGIDYSVTRKGPDRGTQVELALPASETLARIQESSFPRAVLRAVSEMVLLLLENPKLQTT